MPWPFLPRSGRNNSCPQCQESVSLLYDKGEKAPAKYDAVMRLETDVNGEAQLILPEPAPAHLGITVRLISEHWHWVCWHFVAAQDLIQRGIAVTEPSHESTRSSAAVKVEPGEILFVARPFTFFEELLYPLVKE